MLPPRLTSVWGDDAQEWNPDRWLHFDWTAKEAQGIGMTSNLCVMSIILPDRELNNLLPFVA